ncbi:MAG: Hpt domain-containing protein, partial [Spirochaetales bacterium]|nr:Hpt domain-containing protein [Spirochaetales bacterium]
METSVSEKVREKLEALTGQFIDSLPEKMAHLRLVIKQLGDISASSDESFWERTRNEFHKISGTGATCGFYDIAAKAHEIEIFLNDCIKKKETGAENTVKKHLADMYSGIMEICAKVRDDFLAGVSPPQDDTTERGEFSRYMCLYKSDLFFTEESRDHLKVFGYTVLSVES